LLIAYTALMPEPLSEHLLQQELMRPRLKGADLTKGLQFWYDGRVSPPGVLTLTGFTITSLVIPS
jgi:hypothetical protein